MTDTYDRTTDLRQQPGVCPACGATMTPGGECRYWPHDTGQQPAQPVIGSLADMDQRAAEIATVNPVPAQPESGEARRHDPPPLLAHEIAFMQECMAAHGLPDMDSVAAERMLATIVSLQFALTEAQRELTAAQQRIEDLKRLWEIDLTALTQVIAERDAAQQRIAGLQRDLENEQARGIHSCHDQCQRPLCVAHRKIRELEALNAERNRQNALAFQERDRARETAIADCVEWLSNYAREYVDKWTIEDGLDSRKAAAWNICVAAARMRAALAGKEPT